MLHGQTTIVTMPGDGIGNQVLARGDSRARSGRLRGRLRARRYRLGVLVSRKAMRCPSAPSNCCASTRSDCSAPSPPSRRKRPKPNSSPALRGKGHQYFSPIVSMRQMFNLDVCMRPCLSFPGNPLNFIRKKPAGGFEEPKVDVVVFRQNTEGLYAGVEWTQSSAAGARCAAHAPQVQALRRMSPGEDLAISVRIITRRQRGASAKPRSSMRASSATSR